MSHTQPGWPAFLARLFKRGHGARDFGAADAGQPSADTPATSVAAVVDDLAGRVQRAAESILEGEGLTGDLDDAAATALLEWGVACAQRVALRSASGLSDAGLEASMADQLRAVRRLMRLVSQWAGGAQEDALWRRLMEQAALVYGQDLAPDEAQRAALLSQPAQAPLQLIAGLRRLLESGAQLASPSERTYG